MRRVSPNTTPVQISGMLLLWDSKMNQPVFVVLEGITFLPVFSTAEKLIQAREQFDPNYIVKQIDDPEEFLESVRGQVRIMLDPWITPEGNTRFLEIPNT